jgi:hypothetical protein
MGQVREEKQGHMAARIEVGRKVGTATHYRRRGQGWGMGGTEGRGT